MSADTIETPAAALAERLAAMRGTAGLTQVQLAAELGWTQPEVSHVEAGAARSHGRLPSPATLGAWARACGQPDGADDLLALRSAVLAAGDRERSEAPKKRGRPGMSGGCTQHGGCDPADCADRTHTWSVRASGNLIAAVRELAGEGKMSEYAVAAIAEKLERDGRAVKGRKPRPRKSVPATVFQAPPEAGS